MATNNTYKFSALFLSYEEGFQKFLAMRLSRMGFNIFFDEKQILNEKINYIFLFAFFSKNLNKRQLKDHTDKIKNSIKLAKIQKAKLILFFPYSVPEETYSEINRIIKELKKEKVSKKIILLGEILNKKSEEYNLGYLKDISQNLFLKNRLLKSSDESCFYGLSIKKAAPTIFRNVFSFGYSSESLAIISREISINNLVDNLARSFPNAKVLNGVQYGKYKFLPANKIIYVDLKVGKIVRNLLAEKEGGEKDKAPLFHKRFFAKKSKSVISKMLKLLVAMLIILPFLTIPINLVALLFVQATPLRPILYCSKVIVVTSEKIDRAYVNLPVAGGVYKTPAKLAKISGAIVAYQESEKNIYDSAINIMNDIFDANNNFLSEDVNAVISELDNLYQEISYVGLEYGLSGPSRLDLLTPGIRNLNDAFINRQNLVNRRGFFAKLNTILGESKQMGYLAILQDNNILRPTGGKIIGTSTLYFDKNMFRNHKILNLDQIDSGVLGYVEPPAPIKKYIGSSWKYSDANWYLDLPSSANKVEWFVAKAVNENYDGVLFIDLDLLESYSDFLAKQKINNEFAPTLATNLKLLSDVYKKVEGMPDERNIAGNVLNNFLESFRALSSQDKLKALALFEKNINSKNLQIYVNVADLNNAISKVTGGEDIKCEDNCKHDNLRLVDTNLGKSSSKLITKTVSLDVLFEEKLIKKVLTLSVSNTQPKNSKSIYQTYLRISDDNNSSFSPIIVEGGDKARVIPEITKNSYGKEAGVYLQVLPGETEKVVFSWENYTNLDFSKKGSYALKIIKQPGETPIDYEIAYYLPKIANYNLNPAFLLTKEGIREYNTKLIGDLTVKLDW